MQKVTDKSLKIISLNIENINHYSTIFPFFFNQDPDILLLQEVVEEDLALFQKNLQMNFVFVPLAKVNFPSGLKTIGIATFTKHKIAKHQVKYYRGSKKEMPVIDKSEGDKLNRAILVTWVEKESRQFILINTHFTWADGGVPTQMQKNDLAKMLSLLKNYKKFVLGGDFNAPRGEEIFDELATIYKDNIPKNITTTIDKSLHYAGDLQIVVDGLFTTKGLLAKDVQVIGGVSDHCAIAANIESK